MDRNSSAPALESHIPQIVLAVHESPVHIKSNRSYYSVPNFSPKQQGQLLAGAVDSINQYSQIFTSEDQGTSCTQNFLVSCRHRSPQTAESNSSNPTKPLTQQGERAADTFEEYEKSLQYNATADQCTARTQGRLTLPVHESRLCGKNNQSSPFVSAPTPTQKDTVEALAQTLQIYAFEDQHLLGTQDLSSDVHKFPHPTESNPNSSLYLDVPPTRKGAQILQIYVAEDQGTTETKDRFLSPVHDSQLSVGSNQKNPAEADVSSTQQEECEDFAPSLQTKASDFPATSGTQTLLVSNYHEFLLPVETNSRNASVTDVSSGLQGGCGQDVLEAIAQALIYTFNDQAASGTQDLLLLSASEPGLSPKEQCVCATDINEAPAQDVQICMSEDQSTPGNEDAVVLAQHQFPPSSENNSNNYSEPDLSPAQQVGCDRDSLEAQAQGIRSYAYEEHCTPTTQDSLESIVQDPPQVAKSVLNSFSFQEAPPVQEKQYIPDTFEALEHAVQMSKNQAVSGTQDVGTNDRATNAGGSSEGNGLAENAVVASYGDATKSEENQRAQDGPTFQEMSGSRISSVRRYSVIDSNKTSSSSNYSDNASHDMFPSRPSLSDTDDETDRAESVAAMMSLVNRYSDYFEDIEENQSEPYVITMISAYVENASALMGNVRLVAARIFTSPNSAANLLYDINWTVLYLAVDEEVDLHDISSCYKLRLLAIKAYIRTTCVNTAEGAVTEAIRQEFLANSSLAGEQNGCTSQVASRLQETDVGAEGAIPFSNGVYRDDVIPASDGTHIKGGRGCKQVYSGCHRYQHKDTARQRAAVLKICYIAEERVCRIRIINWVMLNCFKTVLSVLGLGLEAKRMAQWAVKEAMRRQFPGTNHVVVAIAELAIAASNFAEMALKHMEQAVRLHRIVVEALKQAERSLYNLNAEACCGRNDIRDIIACVNVVEEAVQRTCEIYLDKVDGNIPADTSGAVLPPFQSSKLRAPMILHQRSDQDPRDVFQALFWATESAVKTIDVTLRGLQNLSLSVLFNAVHAGKL